MTPGAVPILLRSLSYLATLCTIRNLAEYTLGDDMLLNLC